MYDRHPAGIVVKVDLSSPLTFSLNPPGYNP